MAVWGLVLILLLCIGCTGSSNEVAQTTQPPMETMVTTIQPFYTEPQEILNINYRDFNSMFEGTTDIQQRNLFDKEFKGVYVQWKCILDDIDETNSRYMLFARCKPCTTISCYGDMTITLRNDQKEKAHALKKGEQVEFIASLTSRYAAEDGIITE